MAKKKTENIKAAPVLKAGSGGEQPTPAPEQTGTRTYQIMDPWKDRDVINLVDVKAVDGKITEVKVNGQPAGGGGGTATVTITNNTSDKGVFVRGPVIVNGMIMTDKHVNDTWTINVGSSATYTVPLASSGVQFYADGIPAPDEIIMTGGCTWDANLICFIITSDCTITI